MTEEFENAMNESLTIENAANYLQYNRKKTPSSSRINILVDGYRKGARWAYGWCCGREVAKKTSVAIDGWRKQQAIIEKLKEAVEYYADLNRWEPTTHDFTLDGTGCADFSCHKLYVGQPPYQVGGKRARQALAEVEEMEKE